MFKETTAYKKINQLRKRIRVIQGGTSASKTISVLLYLIGYAQTDKKKTLTSIVSESIPHLKRGVIRDFKNILQTHGYWKDANWNETDKIYTLETGSQIEFFSTDNGDKLRGARRDRLFVNEANNVELEAFEQLEIRTNEFVIIDYNPTVEFWAHTELIGKRDDVDFIILTYLDNEALVDSVREAIEKRRDKKNWWRVYGEGQIGEVESRIYTGWQIIDSKPHEARLVRYGLDFGYTNDPTAIVAVYKYNGGFIVDEVLYHKGKTNRQIADVQLNIPQCLTIADSAEPKSIDELKSYGLEVMPANKGQGSVNHGIQIVQDQRISVTAQSLNVIDEYRKYVWITDKNGLILNTPEDGYNHAMDALRYAMETLVEVERKPTELDIYFMEQARKNSGRNFAR